MSPAALAPAASNVAPAAPKRDIAPPATECTKLPCSIAWTARGRVFTATVRADEIFGAAVTTTIDGAASLDTSVALGESARVLDLELADVTGDGLLDLVVRTDVPGQSVWLFAPRSTVGEDKIGFDELKWTAAALGTVPAHYDLHNAAAKMRTFEPPDDTLPTERIVHRLACTTLAELRQLVPDKGLDICDERSGNAYPHGKTCHHYTREALSPHVLPSWFSTSDSNAIDENSGPHAVQCTPSKNAVFCSRDTGGPATVEYTFQGTGSARRLTEATFSSYESS